MAITDVLNLTPQLVAEQNPELHQMRKIAFGENYLQDIAGDTGTAQYYSGWGNVPSWAQQAMTTDEAYTTPAVTGTTTNIGVGGGPDAGIMSVTPTDTISGMPGSMPTVPAGGMEGGVWGPMDYLQPTIQDPMAGDAAVAEAIAAQDRQDAFNQQFAFEDAKTQALSGIGPDVILPERRPDDLLPEGFDPFFSLEAPGITPFTPETILPEARPDIYTDRIMDPNLMRIEQERAVQDASYPIAGLSTEQKQLYNQLDTSNLIDPNNAGKDKYGKNIITGADTLGVLGNTYEEGVREYVEKYGDKEYTTPLAQQKQKDYNALVDAWDERDAVTGILPPSRLSPEEIEETIAPKTYAEKTEDIYRNIEIIEPRPGITIYHNTKTGVTGDNIEDVIEQTITEPAVTTPIVQDPDTGSAQIAERIAAENRAAAQAEAQAAASRAAAAQAVSRHTDPGAGGGRGDQPSGSVSTGAGRNPWGRAKGGLIRKQYGSGGIVDLL